MEKDWLYFSGTNNCQMQPYAMGNFHYSNVNIYKLSVSVIIVLEMLLYNAPFCTPFSGSNIVNALHFVIVLTKQSVQKCSPL